MPYPIAELPYGLRRRLRELATSHEARKFQLAAPDLAGLQPIVKFEIPVNVETVTFHACKNVQTHYFPRNLEYNNCKKTYFRVTGYLKFQSFTQSPDYNAIREQFVFANQHRVLVYYCHISLKFLQEFKANMKDIVEVLDICYCTFDLDVTSNGITEMFGQLCKVFIG